MDVPAPRSSVSLMLEAMPLRLQQWNWYRAISMTSVGIDLVEIYDLHRSRQFGAAADQVIVLVDGLGIAARGHVGGDQRHVGHIGDRILFRLHRHGVGCVDRDAVIGKREDGSGNRSGFQVGLEAGLGIFVDADIGERKF